jgi:hypothetical protein
MVAPTITRGRRSRKATGVRSFRGCARDRQGLNSFGLGTAVEKRIERLRCSSSASGNTLRDEAANRLTPAILKNFMSYDSQLQHAVLSELAWEPSVAAAHVGVTAKGGVVSRPKSQSKNLLNRVSQL